MATIGLVALAFRTALLVQVAGTPYAEVTNVDSSSYHAWALEIVNGSWMPTRMFYQSPFYAWFLAGIYEVFGTGPWAPRVIQILFGAASPVLLYAIGAMLFSRRVGWIAGLALALYGPIVLEEITLSKTSPLVFTALAAFAAWVRWAPRARPVGLGIAGLLFGVTIVGVAQWLLPFAVLAVVTWFVIGGPTPRRALAVAVFVTAALVPLVPVVAWNSAHGGGLVLTSGGSGLNLYSGNNPRATGLPAAPSGVRDTPEYEEEDSRRVAEAAVGHPLLPAGVERYWSGQATAFVRDNPGDFVTLLGRKTQVLWNAYEIPDNYHYTFVRTHFLPLLWLGLTFAIVAPLSLVGLPMAARRGRAVWGLYAVTLGYLVTPLIYYVRARYRLPAIPFLMVFGAVAIDHLIGVATARRWGVLAGWCAALAVAGVFVNRTYCEPAHHGMSSLCLGSDVWFDLEWKRLASFYQKQGDTEREQGYVERALECTVPRQQGDTYLWIAWLESRNAKRLLGQGDAAGADARFRRAERFFRSTIGLRHRVAFTHGQLAQLYGTMHMPGPAAASWEAARAAGSGDRTTLVGLGTSYAALGRCADATDVLAKADQAQGLTTQSDETARILAGCAAPASP
jgi:4-amino-4-deoxy-L-arabinose transferase-like glycosyltransferase